jgi:hypothetical protein
LKRLSQAESYGLSAEKFDEWNSIPQVHLLLAQVYEAKGDQEAEKCGLRQFLKDGPHNSDWVTTRAKLSDRKDRAGK